MLKSRVIATFFLMDGRLVQSRTFSEHRVIGDPVQELERVHDWDADEIVYLDISRRPSPIKDVLEAVAGRLFCPLAFGGNVRTFDHAEYLIRNGAEKVVINTAAIESPSFIEAVARKFGSQSVVVAIDYRDNRVYSHHGSVKRDFTPLQWAQSVEKLGAGEIFLNSIDRDGTGRGYDVVTIRDVSQIVGIPVIASGGVGRPDHFIDGLKAGASAVSAGNYFHFTENAYPRAKKYLREKGAHVR